jgi:hypothetical protein
MATRYYKGSLLKNIQIETNDPVTPMVTLVMKARIQEIVSVNPPEIDFGTVKIGSKSKHAVVIVNKGKDPVEITSMSPSPAGVITLPNQGQVKINPGKTYGFDVSFQPTEMNEYFFGVINITVGPDNIPKNVRIKARVVKE